MAEGGSRGRGFLLEVVAPGSDPAALPLVEAALSGEEEESFHVGVVGVCRVVVPESRTTHAARAAGRRQGTHARQSRSLALTSRGCAAACVGDMWRLLVVQNKKIDTNGATEGNVCVCMHIRRFQPYFAPNRDLLV